MPKASSKASDMQYKVNDLVEESAKLGLKLNSAKTRILDYAESIFKSMGHAIQTQRSC